MPLRFWGSDGRMCMSSAVEDLYRPRSVGERQVWTGYRQEGGVGFRGDGEPQGSIDRTFRMTLAFP